MKTRGFTLIELLVVIAIIGLLAGVILASVNNARGKGTYAAAKQLDANFAHNLGDSLVGQWLFDECSGTTAADSSGFGNSGALGSITYSTVTPLGSGCSASFPGSIGIDVGSSGTLFPVAFSVSGWINRTAHNSYDYIYSNARDNCGTGESGVDIAALSDDTMRAVICDNGTRRYVSAPGFSPSIWIFVMFTYDGTTARLYKNGALVNSAVFTASPMHPATYHTYLGRMGFGTTYALKGMLDNVRVYERALDTSEVRALYLAEAPRHGVAFTGSSDGFPF